MKDSDATGGRGGRPSRRLIGEPRAMREEGRKKFLEAQRDYERNPYFDGKPRTPPMAPNDRWDEGLVYASRADLIAPQSVRRLAEQAREQVKAFRQLFRCRPGAAGPMRDADEATELWLASQFVKKATQRAEKHGRVVGTSEVADIRDALELLFEEDLSEATLKKRRQRLRDLKRGGG